MEKVDSFANRLRQAMTDRRIKAVTLEALTGISHASISSYLHGRYEANAVNLQSLASVLLVNPIWLMGYEAPKAVPHLELQGLVEQLSDEQSEEVVKFIKTFILK